MFVPYVQLEIILSLLLACLSFAQSRDKNLMNSPFNCGSNATWPVSTDDNVEMTEYFHDWLLVWQFSCEGNTKINHRVVSNGGLGSSFVFGSRWLTDAIKLKQIYRPYHEQPWLWAAETAENCTLGQRSYDCFSEPLSDCEISSSKRTPELEKQINDALGRMVDNPLRFVMQQETDICTFAKILRKPIKWVHGHIIQYMIRPRMDVLKVVEKRSKEVFADLPEKTVSMGIQIRSGPKMDNGRIPFNSTDDILSIIDSQVKEIKLKYDQNVGMVFLCGDVPELTYQSAEYMNTHYKRPFTFRTTPRISFGIEEVELSLRAGQNPNHASRLDMFTDFVTDIEILSSVDYLYGSHSNVYMIALALRWAKDKGPNKSCLVDHRERELFICEGTGQKADQLWTFYYPEHYTIFTSQNA